MTDENPTELRAQLARLRTSMVAAQRQYFVDPTKTRRRVAHWVGKINAVLVRLSAAERANA